MSDNVTFQATAATPPTGTVVSTEEATTLNGGAVTAQQVQRILLALRTGDGVVIDLPGDETNGLKVQGTLTISAGAATAANQATEITGLSSIDGHVDGIEASLTSIDSKITAVNTGAVVVSSSALPAGAASAANQATSNASLVSIDGKTPALGGASASASVPVTLATDGIFVGVVGAAGDAAIVTDTTGGLSGKLRGLVKWAFERMPASLGQKAMAASLPVVLASDQASIPVASTLQAGEAHAGEIGGNISQVTVELTRPSDTTAYTIGDVVSNSTSATVLLVFTNVARVNAGTGYIVAAILNTDKKSITPRLRVHLYNASNPTVSNDNAAHRELYADIGKKITHFDMPAMVTPADTTNSTLSRTVENNIRIPYVCAAASRTLYILLEAMDAFTPASAEKFSLTLIAENN